MAAEAFLIHGQLAGAAFAPWLLRHADRLGLSARIEDSSAERLRAVISGPEDLLDAMEMGCLLGPFQVWVDRIDRSSVTPAGPVASVKPASPVA